MDQNIQKILEIKNKKMQKAFNQNHIELLFLDNKQELLNYLDFLLKYITKPGITPNKIASNVNPKK